VVAFASVEVVMSSKRAGFVVALCLLLLAVGRPASAVPFLQLDIAGGVYDATPGVETIFATTDPFTLYALLTPGGEGAPTGSVDLTRQYFLSAAVVPRMPLTVPPPALGVVSIGATSYNVTGDFRWGQPPIESVAALQPPDSRDLAAHGVFETYFIEIPFTFSALNTAATYNTQDNPGGLSPGTGSYYAAFAVDTTGLAAGHYLHFDLYNKVVGTGKPPGSDPFDVGEFAPFSHDAQSGPPPSVPEPGTASLVALGLALFAGVRYRRTGRLS
jgi:hypothetical protein